MAEWEAMKEEKRKASINPQDKPDGDDDDDDDKTANLSLVFSSLPLIL
jgi:hypothetical protein